MMTSSGALVVTLVPLIFIMAGILVVAYRLIVGRQTSAPDTTKIDPDIRVRVTGKIS